MATATAANRTERNAEHAENRRRLLEEKVLLLAPSFGWWRGHYQLPQNKITVELSGEEVANDDITTPRAKLMTDKAPKDSAGKPWKKRFQELNSRQAAVVDSYSVPFPIRGVRIVPKASGEEFLKKLEDVRRDLDTAVGEFVDDLEGVLQQIKDNADASVWEAVEAKIPRRRDQMRAKFYVDVCPIELAGGNPAAVDRNALAAHNDIVREATRRKVDEAVEAIIAAPRIELAKAIAGLKDVIGRNGKVTAKSFRPVTEAMQKLRAFTFVADDQILRTIKELEDRMRITTPTSLDSTTAVTSGFAAALDAVVAEVTDAANQAAVIEDFGRELRGITL